MGWAEPHTPHPRAEIDGLRSQRASMSAEIHDLRAVITAAYDELRDAGYPLTSPVMLALADEVDR